MRCSEHARDAIERTNQARGDAEVNVGAPWRVLRGTVVQTTRNWPYFPVSLYKNGGLV